MCGKTRNSMNTVSNRVDEDEDGEEEDEDDDAVSNELHNRIKCWNGVEREEEEEEEGVDLEGGVGFVK